MHVLVCFLALVAPVLSRFCTENICAVLRLRQELRVHYDQQSMQGEALEAALKKHLAKLCDSKFTVRPVCIPVLDIHIANREGGFAPVSAHAQMLALGVAW